MPKTAQIQTATDLLSYLENRDPLAHRYVALLKRCAVKGYPLGMMEDAIQAEALSDWEAAACLSGDLKVGAITETRRGFREGLIVEDGHRAGQATYALHHRLIG